ncbi:MAG: polyphosphate polymerase domain-containing protein [Bacteroidales bacterium]|nr:polyphosphate polymerase domain-containing protein [Bacteroidales bacterium]
MITTTPHTGIKEKEYTPLLRQRYERKFAIQMLSRSAVEHIIKYHPAAFSEIYKQRNVNNIYLDTGRLSYYHDNVSGSNKRKKVRIRWYGDMFGDVEQPVLEIKLKNGYIGRKQSFPLKPFVVDERFDIEMLRSVFRQSELPLNLMSEVTELQPALLNGYSRKYFQNFKKDFRITVDDHLVYMDIKTRFNTFNRQELIDIGVIVELKYDATKDDLAEGITNYFPFRMTKSSKYVNGIDLLHPDPSM